MKRTIAFKAFKYVSRGTWYTIVYTYKNVATCYRFMGKLAKDAMSKKGSCPKCDSLDIDYTGKLVYNLNINKSQKISIPFKCNSCDLRGHEYYELDYEKSTISKPIKVTIASKKKEKA